MDSKKWFADGMQKHTECVEGTECNHLCIKCGKRETGKWMHAEQLRERQMCFECSYWQDLVELASHPIEKHNCVRIDGVHYFIGHPDAGGMRGFGGRLFRIKFKDGTVRQTTNLWHQGTVPDLFKDELPDNVDVMEEF